MPTAATAAPDATESPLESGSRRKISRHEVETGNTANTNTKRGGSFSGRNLTQSGAGGQAAGATVGDAEELFTDLELMEDSRAIDFSVRKFSGSNASCGRSSGGGGGGAVDRAGGKGASGTSARGSGGASKGSRAPANSAAFIRRSPGGSSGSSRPGNYYDWFLSKLEGKEMGIIRGDIDARGKSVKSGGSGAGGGAAGAAGGGGGDDSGGLQTATLPELLEKVHDMVEELDVPDDGLSKDRHTQGEEGGGLESPFGRGLSLTCPNFNFGCAPAGV